MKDLIKITLAFTFLSGVLVGYANAQTVDLSTREAVIVRLGKLKNMDFSKPNICIKRLKDSAKVIVVGSFALDRGCRLDGVFVNSVYFTSDAAHLSKRALAALGWKRANQKERERLVKLWVEKGLLAFYRVLDTKGEDFNAGEFYPPQYVSNENGEIAAALWVSVVRRKKEFGQRKFKFNKDGDLMPFTDN